MCGCTKTPNQLNTVIKALQNSYPEREIFCTEIYCISLPTEIKYLGPGETHPSIFYFGNFSSVINDDGDFVLVENQLIACKDVEDFNINYLNFYGWRVEIHGGFSSSAITAVDFVLYSDDCPFETVISEPDVVDLYYNVASNLYYLDNKGQTLANHQDLDAEAVAIEINGIIYKLIAGQLQLFECK